MIVVSPVEKSKLNTSLSARRGFKRYGVNVDRARVGKPIVKKDKVLEQLIAAFNKTKCSSRRAPNYDTARNTIYAIGKTLYSQKEIERFSRILPVFQHEDRFGERAGMFLSALINLGYEKKYIVHTDPLIIPVDFLGYKNKKKILVKGDIGHSGGQGMHCGEMIVEGKAKSHVGFYLKGGCITVKQKAGDYIGSLMDNGRITIGGSSGEHIGWGMKGGVIHLDGDYKSIFWWEGKEVEGIDTGKMEGGRIYHKGNLIIDL